MVSGEIGAHLSTYGVHAYFKPFYFDGRTVWWGEPEITMSEAMSSAAKIKTSLFDRVYNADGSIR